jgi:[ribosomal protein S5]-alanine N-acetyltransferase
VSAHPDWQSTARLSLRPPTAEDAPAVLRILSNRTVVEHNPSDLVLDLSEIEVLLGRWLDHWAEHGFGNCCVFEKATGRLVGNCGVRWMTVHEAPVLNLMYRFDPSIWGRGYATEAARAVLDWTFQAMPDQLVLARIRPGNLASQAVASKIGLRRDPSFDDQGPDGLDWAFTSRPHQGSAANTGHASLR